MHFTLVFAADGIGPSKRTYHLVFHPCPIWTRYADDHDEWEIVNPSRVSDSLGGPRYQIGHLEPLLEKEGFSADPNPNVILCVQPHGHGTEEDIETLNQDLGLNGFITTVCRLDA